MGTSMHRAARAACCLLVAGIAIPASSQGEERNLTGTYAIAGKDAIDPPPDQPRDTHLQLFLSGSAAKDLYDALKVKPVPDECIGGGARSKFQGAIACTMHGGGKKFECSFAVDLKNQALESVYAC